MPGVHRRGTISNNAIRKKPPLWLRAAMALFNTRDHQKVTDDDEAPGVNRELPPNRLPMTLGRPLVSV